MKLNLPKTARLELDMTPMIDVTFQLLTFFMLVINFENTQADERVKLPRSALAKPPKVPAEDRLILNVGFNRDLEGTILSGPFCFYNGEQVTIAEMAPRLKREVETYRLFHPGEESVKTVVEIRSDGEVPTGLVQELIKHAQAARFEHFILKAEELVPP